MNVNVKKYESASILRNEGSQTPLEGLISKNKQFIESYVTYKHGRTLGITMKQKLLMHLSCLSKRVETEGKDETRACCDCDVRTPSSG